MTFRFLVRYKTDIYNLASDGFCDLRFTRLQTARLLIAVTLDIFKGLWLKLQRNQIILVNHVLCRRLLI